MRLNQIMAKFFVVFFLLATSSKLFAKQTPIFLHYAERPPYAITVSEGHVTGLFSTPMEKAFKKAKIPFVWVKTPINRQFLLMKENTTPGSERHCAVGYYKTPEREKTTKFTRAYYQTQGLVVIAGLKIKKNNIKTFKKFMKTYSIVIKENYSYGPQVDEFLKKIKPNTITTSGEAPQMIDMVTQGHGDYMVVSREEINYYFKKGYAKKDKLHVYTFPDLTKSLYRYVMCSKSVSDKTLAKINAAIDFKIVD